MYYGHITLGRLNDILLYLIPWGLSPREDFLFVFSALWPWSTAKVGTFNYPAMLFMG